MKTLCYLIGSFLFASSIFANDIESKLEEVNSFQTKSFSYAKLSSYPYAIEKFAHGIGFGHRRTISSSNSLDVSAHVMKTDLDALHVCGKVNHVFYFLKNFPVIAPYVGFGAIGGLSYFDKEVEMKKEDGSAYQIVKQQCAPFFNGELSLGMELHVHESIVQFIELTYYAKSSSIQLSFGFGF